MLESLCQPSLWYHEALVGRDLSAATLAAPAAPPRDALSVPGHWEKNVIAASCLWQALCYLCSNPVPLDPKWHCTSLVFGHISAWNLNTSKLSMEDALFPNRLFLQVYLTLVAASSPDAQVFIILLFVFLSAIPLHTEHSRGNHPSQSLAISINQTTLLLDW